jgi:hypothetical protein
MKTATKQCKECRDGEHENLTEDVRFYTVWPAGGFPSSNRPVRMWLCSDHVHCILDDGGKLELANPR